MSLIDPLLGNDSINTFPRRQILGKEPLLGNAYDNTSQYRTNKEAAIEISDKNERFFLSGPRWDCLLGNCVVTRLYKNRGDVFSVLRGPCRENIREWNSESSSCSSTEECKQYKEYNRGYNNENWRSTRELSIGDSHGKFMVEEELETSLRKHSVS
jgi:hypothetical protein